MTRSITLVLLALIIQGCVSIQAPTYQPSAENVAVLRDAQAQIAVAPFENNTGKNDLICRAAGPIVPPQGMSFVEYIQEALIAELRVARIYASDSDIILTGRLDAIDFSSTAGTWQLRLAASVGGSDEYITEVNYSFATGFSAARACQQVATEYRGAVRALIHEIISAPAFQQVLAQGN